MKKLISFAAFVLVSLILCQARAGTSADLSGVVSVGGIPQAGASVAYSLNGVSTVCTASTGVDGSYSCIVPSIGSITITATQAGYAFETLIRSNVAIAETGASIRGAALVFSMAGVVRDPGGNPVSGVNLGWSQALLTGVQVNGTCGTTGVDGSYSCRMPSGEIWMQGVRSGYAVALFHRYNLVSDETGADILAAALTRSISGVVKDASGAPWSGVMVQWTGMGLWGYCNDVTSTGADGTYTCKVPNGFSGTLSVLRRAGQAFVTLPRTNVLNDETGADILGVALVRTVAGTVKDVVGNLLSGADVSWNSPSLGLTVSCGRTLADGAYICNVPQDFTGTVNANISAIGANISRTFTNVTSDLTGQTVAPGNVAISGKVVVDGVAHAGAQVDANWAGGGHVLCTASTGVDGSYSCSVPSIGSITITAKQMGHIFQTIGRDRVAVAEVGADILGFVLRRSIAGAMVSAGRHHAMARDTSGAVWSWGWVAGDVLDQQASNYSTTPYIVSGLSSFTISKVVAGDGRSFAITNAGAVVGWGDHRHGELGNGEANATDVPSSSPVFATGLTDVVQLDDGHGSSSPMALKSDGTVWSWGWDRDGLGTLGLGGTRLQLIPAKIVELSNVIQVASGIDVKLALTGDGRVWGWGSNSQGQIGQSTPTTGFAPVVVPGLTGVKQIVASAWSGAAALKVDGTVWRWGGPPSLAYGDNFNPTPQQIQDLTDVVQIEPILAGFGRLLSVTSDGRVFKSDLLGTSQVVGLPPISSVSSGEGYTLALDRAGNVWAWGSGYGYLNNQNGELGNGTTLASLQPVQALFANGTALNLAPPGTEAVDATAPGAPIGVTAVAGNGSANISFTAPSSNGGATITAYTVSSDPGGLTATGATSPIAVIGLANGIAYTFTVRATNSAGTGVVSLASNSVTPVGVTTSTSTTTTTTTTSSTTTTTQAGANINLVPGWNLVGNGVEAPINVASTFNDATKVTTVWKWVTTGSTPGMTYPAWAFYTPVFADGGQAYAASKGYEYLATIGAAEGFWVNAKAAFSVNLPSGSVVRSSSFMPAITSMGIAGGTHALPRGWSLIATGDNPTPAQFDAAIATFDAIPPAAGSNNVYTNLTTLWAWDASRTSWYFWAPVLVNNGGLAAYLTSKGYLDFATMPGTLAGRLSPSTGVWVNMP